jgi:hypothetical protein
MKLRKHAKEKTAPGDQTGAANPNFDGQRQLTNPDSSKPEGFEQPQTPLPGWPDQRPPGEDYFLLECEIDTPSDISWNNGFSVAGTWALVSEAYALIIPVLLQTKRTGSFRLTQGKARVAARLAFLAREERRYQDEKRSIGLN